MARTSRWDRPSAPKDVRWFVRLVGKILITTGLLMFGFVAYQLWGTGIEYARAQDELSDQFDELLAATSTTAGPTASAATTSTATTSTAAPTASPPTTLAGATSVATTTSTSAPTTTVAPTTTIGPTTNAEPPLLDFGYATDDVPLAQLWIPSIGIEAMNIVQGVGRDDLKQGPGHYPSTAFPGELGNAAIAGHRTTFGGPFEALPDVQVGDQIALLTPNGTFTYQMTDFTVVNPDDGWVVQTTDPTMATLTLTTCTPKGTAEQRYVLFAELIPELSAPVGRYVPRDTNGTAALPGDEGSEPAATTPTSTTTTTVAPTTSAAEAITAQSTPSTTAPTTTDAVTVTTDDPVVTLSSAGVEPSGLASPDDADTAADEEAFGSHWFDDRAAVPQVLLWGAITTAIVVVAYQIAKHFRNSWIGLAVGVVPFLVTLYFFYQNVNRLMPAAL